MEEDQVNGDLRAIQLVQNDFLRLLNGTRIKDEVSIESMLHKYEMRSGNQLNVENQALGNMEISECSGLPIKTGKTRTKQKWQCDQRLFKGQYM